MVRHASSLSGKQTNLHGNVLEKLRATLLQNLADTVECAPNVKQENKVNHPKRTNSKRATWNAQKKEIKERGFTVLALRQPSSTQRRRVNRQVGVLC